MWNIIAPPSAKYLLWRICRGFLPTRMRLLQCFVQCPPNCQMCDNVEEDDWHMLFGCRMAAGFSSIIEPRLHDFSDVKTLILDICSKEDMRTVGRVVVLIWMLWINRNNVIWNNERDEVTKLGMQAYHIWHD